MQTRVTNKNAIAAYRAWGFMKEENPADDPFIKFKEHWINLEYKIVDSDKLKCIAEGMIEKFKVQRK